MRVRRVLCLASVLALVGLGFAGESTAAKAQKVDLTEYLDGFPQPGDFRVYNRSDGETLRSEVLDLLEHKKSTELLYEVSEAGDVQQEIDEIVHGKEARVGSAFFGDLAFVIAHPKRIQSFRVVPGRPQKYKIGLKVFYQGERAGKATLAGTSMFVGFELLLDSTLNRRGIWEGAHLHREQTLTVKVGHSVFKTVSTSDAWITLELGTVRVERVSQSYQDGVFLETFGPFEYTFDHGQYQGVPFS